MAGGEDSNIAARHHAASRKCDTDHQRLRKSQNPIYIRSCARLLELNSLRPWDVEAHVILVVSCTPGSILPLWRAAIAVHELDSVLCDDSCFMD